jgi:hypothetical protein
MRKPGSVFRPILFAVATIATFLCAPVYSGGTSGDGGLEAAAAAGPGITGLSPSVVTAGGPGFDLTIDGFGFEPGSTVQCNGEQRATTYVSSNRLIAAILASDIAPNPNDRYRYIRVSSPFTSEIAEAMFTVVAAGPSITWINPTSAVAGGSGFSLYVTGYDFDDAVVRWNGMDRTTTTNLSAGDARSGGGAATPQLPKTIKASILASDIASVGTAQVTVFNRAGGGVSSPVSFQITATNPVPAITSGPTQLYVGGDPSTVLVTGTNLIPGSVVRWNGSDRPTVFMGGSLQAQITASDTAAVGSATITVFNPPPGGGTSNAVTVPIVNPVPYIERLYPASARAGSGSVTLTVEGSGFVSNSIVRWNGFARTTKFVDGKRLTAVIDTADVAEAGSVLVTVFNTSPGGGDSERYSAWFVILPAPPTLEIELSSGAYTAGSTVTATTFRFRNPGAQAAPIEAKIWLTIPGNPPISVLNFGSDGSVSLPARFTQDIGPLSLLRVSSSTATGSYEFSSRVIDPMTGELFSEDLNPFTVGAASGAFVIEEDSDAAETTPSLEIELDKTTFASGDTVWAKLKLRNPAAASARVEMKLWMGAPGGVVSNYFNSGSDGSLVLPASADMNLGPLGVLYVAAGLVRGTHEFSGRLLDPVTGKQHSESLKPFLVDTPWRTSSPHAAAIR